MSAYESIRQRLIETLAFAEGREKGARVHQVEVPEVDVATIRASELFQGKRPDIPWVDASVLKSAKREDTTKQGQLI